MLRVRNQEPISPSTTHNDSSFVGALAFQYIEQQREEDNHAAKIAATEVMLGENCAISDDKANRGFSLQNAEFFCCLDSP